MDNLWTVHDLPFDCILYEEILGQDQGHEGKYKESFETRIIYSQKKKT